VVERKYEQHLTAFVDLLGFSEASFGEPKKTDALLQMLQRLFRLQSESGTDWTGEKDNSSFVITPAISSFSDNIVVSYPFSHILDFVDDESEIALALTFQNLRYIIGYIAAEAFLLGFLIRGGIALGGLYHSSGIVFGEALIEAYRVEREVAVNPRVVFSPTVVRYPGFTRLDSRLLREDIDHEYCFEYIFPMIMNSTDKSPRIIDGIKRWYIDHIGFVDDKIRTLLQSAKNKEAAKWEWFKTELSKSLIRHGASSTTKSESGY
jgi:hypothetical protein